MDKRDATVMILSGLLSKWYPADYNENILNNARRYADALYGEDDITDRMIEAGREAFDENPDYWDPDETVRRPPVNEMVYRMNIEKIRQALLRGAEKMDEQRRERVSREKDILDARSSEEGETKERP